MNATTRANPHTIFNPRNISRSITDCQNKLSKSQWPTGEELKPTKLPTDDAVPAAPNTHDNAVGGETKVGYEGAEDMVEDKNEKRKKLRQKQINDAMVVYHNFIRHTSV